MNVTLYVPDEDVKDGSFTVASFQLFPWLPDLVHTCVLELLGDTPCALTDNWPVVAPYMW